MSHAIIYKALQHVVELEPKRTLSVVTDASVIVTTSYLISSHSNHKEFLCWYSIYPRWHRVTDSGHRNKAAYSSIICLPGTNNSRMSHIMYATTNKKIPHGNYVAVTEMNNMK